MLKLKYKGSIMTTGEFEKPGKTFQFPLFGKNSERNLKALV